MSLANTVRTTESDYTFRKTRSEQTPTSTHMLRLVHGFAVAALPPTGLTDSGLHGCGGLNGYPRKKHATSYTRVASNATNRQTDRWIIDYDN